MKIKVQKKIKSQKGILIVPVFQDQTKKLSSLYPKKVKEFIKARIKAKDLEGKRGEMTLAYIDARGLPDKLAVIGLGKSDKYGPGTARRMGGKLGKHLAGKKTKEITFLLLPEMMRYAEELLQGIKMTQYKLDQYKTKKHKKGEVPVEINRINFVTDQKNKQLYADFEKALKIVDGVNLVKDLVNSPSNIVDAQYMVKEAKRIAKENKYKIAVFGNKELKKMKWGGILAVNQGSEKEAGAVVLEYNGARSSKEKPIVLVGKGVIFDTGGYNIKPSGYMETMHQDMAGAATVLGVFSILKKLGVKKNVIGVMPIAENLIDAKAYKPSDIITMYSGQTVEITNTDAEGRLILADAISYGTELDPEAIITIATLTGAVSVAVGPRYAGLISNNVGLRREMQKAGRQVDELGWPLPLHRDYKKKMDSEVADIRNHDKGTSREAGCSKAAAFLQRFVKDKKWCHIDIGGTAFTTAPKDYEGKGSTAHGLRMMLRFLENKV